MEKTRLRAPGWAGFAVLAILLTAGASLFLSLRITQLANVVVEYPRLVVAIGTAMTVGLLLLLVGNLVVWHRASRSETQIQHGEDQWWSSEAYLHVLVNALLKSALKWGGEDGAMARTAVVKAFEGIQNPQKRKYWETVLRYAVDGRGREDQFVLEDIEQQDGSMLKGIVYGGINDVPADVTCELVDLGMRIDGKVARRASEMKEQNIVVRRREIPSSLVVAEA